MMIFVLCFISRWLLFYDESEVTNGDADLRIGGEEVLNGKGGGYIQLLGEGLE